MSTQPSPPNRGDDRLLPPSWAESRRFVPRAFVQPALQFLRNEAAGGILMVTAAIIAVMWANSPFGDSYFAFFDTRIEIAFGEFHLHHLSELTVREWINDALMAIFFFVVGLEIKRELVVGELRDPKAAALPAFAALGGMVVPAAIYLMLNAGTETAGGWGIPMATDIAFAAGVAAMAGRRVPVQAKLFLLALAIVDDLGAILVIALFYTEKVSLGWLIAAGVLLAVVWVMGRVEVRHLGVYMVVGSVVWVAVLESGVHATVAGVALALMTPVYAFYDPRRFSPRARELVDRIEEYLPDEEATGRPSHHTLQRVQALMTDLQRLSRESLPPLERLEHMLQPWTSFVIIPVFALANAGVRIDGEALAGAFADPVFLGIALGLLVGKTVGVTGFAWVATKLGLGRLPAKTTWHHMFGMSLLAAIGFTVALFIAALSFQPGSDAADSAKLGIFAASIVAGVIGFVWLRYLGPDPDAVSTDHDAIPDRYQERRRED